jgi:hypothetical protein
MSAALQLVEASATGVCALVAPRHLSYGLSYGLYGAAGHGGSGGAGQGGGGGGGVAPRVPRWVDPSSPLQRYDRLEALCRLLQVGLAPRWDVRCTNVYSRVDGELVLGRGALEAHGRRGCG